MNGENSEKSIKELSEEYLSAVETKVDQEELADAKSHLTELQDRHDRFKQEYGESDPATQELEERVSEAKKRVNDLEKAQQIPEEFEEQILERATRFMLTEEWLNPRVIEALNQALIGERDSALLIEETEVSDQDDVSELDELTRFDFIDVVRKLAMDKLGETDDVKEIWDSIADTTKEEPFKIVASLGSATPDEVLERIEDDDVKRETIRGRLKNTASRMEINPYFRENGVYGLSTVGRYITEEYAETSDETDCETSESTGGKGDGQTTLGQKSVTKRGGSDD
ncbi:hypothetical protein ACFQDG_01900 [Natronoarchaeum mannanilyticum]|uniref:Uncharacterized protein n=1 Tax=Natronoarchaeum mannanilyticum TaxID=926360 RepID=A0AAV3TBX7_9EURY